MQIEGKLGNHYKMTLEDGIKIHELATIGPCHYRGRSGASFEEVLGDHPHLEREDILAAIEYAAHQTDHVVLRSA